MKPSSSKKRILVIAGMPGAGKSLASDVAREQGVPVFVSGDVIRNEARKRGLNLDKTNLGRLMLKIRSEEGMGAVARRLIPIINGTGKSFVVYEGARNIEELDELRNEYDVITVAVQAAPGTRFSRLVRRRRGDKPRTLSDFKERDERELKVGIGKVIALANRTLENEESKAELRRRMRRLLKQAIHNHESVSSPVRKSVVQKTRKR